MDRQIQAEHMTNLQLMEGRAVLAESELKTAKEDKLVMGVISLVVCVVMFVVSCVADHWHHLYRKAMDERDDAQIALGNAERNLMLVQTTSDMLEKELRAKRHPKTCYISHFTGSTITFDCITE